MAGSRIVVAEDDVLLREGIASLLEREGFDVVGTAGDPDALTALVRETSPDLAIIDIRMPPTQTAEGLEAARAIRSESPEIGILLLFAHVEIETAIDLLKDGKGIGFLLKSRVMKVADVVDALERVAEGGSVVDPALVPELVANRHRNDPLEHLTSRERSEALTNAIKHSQASEITVTIRNGERLVASIVADGVGGADPRGGSGLTGLVDRIDALGGRFSFESPPDGGTSIRVELPIAF